MNCRAVSSIATLTVLLSLVMIGCQVPKPKTVKKVEQNKPKQEIQKAENEAPKNELPKNETPASNEGTSTETPNNELPKENASNELPKNETPSELPVNETPSELPVNETPSELPVNEEVVESEETSPATETNEQPSFPAEPVTSPTETEVAQAEPTNEVPEQPKKPLSKADVMLQQFNQKQKLANQQKETYIEHLMKTTKAKIANYEYNQAKSFLDEILALDPQHKEANRLRDLVGSFLGERNSSNSTLYEMYSAEAKVKMEQAKLEARNYFNQGNEALAQNEYERGIRHFEACLEIIKWAPYELNLGDLQKQAQDKITEAKNQQDAWIAEQRQQRMEEARIRAEEMEAQEQARRTEQIRILLSRAMEYYTSKRYEQAELLVDQVLEVDPANKVAKKLQDDIRDASYSYIADKTLERKIEGWKLFLEDIRSAAVPFNQMVRYPDKDYWHNVIAKRQEKGSLVEKEEKSEDSPAVKRIRTILESRKIDWNFVDTPFQEVITYIRSTDEINIVIAPDVLAELDESTKVTLQLKDLFLKEALNILLEFNGLTYIFKDDVLYITRVDSDLAKAKPVPRLHDIRDLTGQVQDFPGPNLRLDQADGDGGNVLFEEETAEGEAVLTGEKLTELIKTSIAPDTWEEEDDYSIDETSGQLLVVHTESIQKEISNFLNDLRRFSGQMVAIETRFLTVTDDFLEKVGVDWRGIGQDSLRAGGDDTIDPRSVDNTIVPLPAFANAGDASGNNFTAGSDNSGSDNSIFTLPSAGAFFRDEFSGGNDDNPAQVDLRTRTENIDDGNVGRLKPTGGLNIQFAILDELRLNAVLRAVKKNSRSEVVMAPRLTTFNTQRANITVLTQEAYVKDFDVEVAQGAFLAQPVIGTIQTGTVLDVRPIISNDRRYITLELRPTIADLVEPLDAADSTFTTTVDGNEIEFTVPQLRLQSVEATVRIPDEGSLIIGGLKEFDQIDRKQDIPILGDIPVVSFFFSQQTQIDEKRELIIVVTAQIIDLQEQEEMAVGTPK